MKRVKVWVFKDTGKWYTEEYIEIPEEITMVYEIVDYITKNYNKYKGMNLVLPFTERHVQFGHPCMIPAESRR